MLKSVSGAVIGLVVGGLLLKKKNNIIGTIGLFSGCGAGMAINKLGY
jgi:hypothetical protein